MREWKNTPDLYALIDTLNLYTRLTPENQFTYKVLPTLYLHRYYYTVQVRNTRTCQHIPDSPLYKIEGIRILVFSKNRENLSNKSDRSNSYYPLNRRLNILSHIYTICTYCSYNEIARLLAAAEPSFVLR